MNSQLLEEVRDVTETLLKPALCFDGSVRMNENRQRIAASTQSPNHFKHLNQKQIAIKDLRI